jgi:hypothetical protein
VPNHTTCVLRHATPLANLKSIERTGLLPSRSQTARNEVWLHKPSRTAWAVLHVARRHKVPIEKIVVLTVRVPRAKLQRRRSCLWSCSQTIQPEQIKASIRVDDLV